MPNPYETYNDPVKAEEEARKIDSAYEAAKKGIVGLYESYETGEDRIASLLEGNKDFFQYIGNPEEMVAKLKACASIGERDKFVQAVFAAGKPIIDLKIERPELFIREGNNREFIKLSDLLSYGIDGDSAHIHVVPDGKVENLFGSFQEGMEKLAGIIEANPGVKTVEAISWIVAKHPKILERMGFTVDGEISEKFRQSHFSGSKEKIYRAHMERDDFLKRYLKKE